MKLKNLCCGLPELVGLMLAAAVILDAGAFAFGLTGRRGSPSLNATSLQLAPPARRADAGSVIAAHLFGSRNASVEAQTLSASQWQLAGTIATSNPRLGFGILRDGASAARVYMAGAQVASGTTLYEIYKDHVTLKSSGRSEILRFTKNASALLASAIVLSSVSTSPNADPAAPDEAQSDVLQPPPDKAAVMLASLNASAVTDGSGQFQGYQVNPLPKMRRELGLRPGDRLVGVNGTVIRDPRDVQAALQGDAVTAVTVTIQRDGELIDVPMPVTSSPAN